MPLTRPHRFDAHRRSGRRVAALLARLQRVSPREVAAWAGVAAAASVLLTVTALAWPVVSRVVLLGGTAVLLAYLVAPLVEAVKRRVGRPERPLPRWAAILIVYLLIGMAGFAAWRLTAPRFERQLTSLSLDAHRAVHVTVDRVRSLDHRALALGVPGPVGDSLAAGVLGLIDELEAQADAVMRETARHTSFLPWLALVPLLSFFLMKDWKTFRRTAVRVLPEGHLRWRGDEFLGSVNSVLAGYARAQLLSCAIIGSLCAVGFALLGIPHPLALGALAGALEFLPVVGPLATALIAASLVSGPRLVLLIAFLVVLRLVQDYAIYPRLVGRRMHLHPLAIVIAVLAGANLGGLVGVFCAVPLVGLGSVVVRHYREWRQIQELIREYEEETAAATLAAGAPTPPPADGHSGSPADPQPRGAADPDRSTDASVGVRPDHAGAN